MLAIALAPEAYDNFAVLLDSMDRLRARVFPERLHWDVTVMDGGEGNNFDTCNPPYVIALSTQNQFVGCARLRPAAGPALLDALFQELRGSGLFKPHARMVESSRFCVDTGHETERAGRRLHDATSTLFAAILQWSMSQGYREIVTATDVGIERTFRQTGRPMTGFGKTRQIANTLASAGLLPAEELSSGHGRPASFSCSFRALVRAA